jgi:hypothetical protein
MFYTRVHVAARASIRAKNELPKTVQPGKISNFRTFLKILSIMAFTNWSAG